MTEHEIARTAPLKRAGGISLILAAAMIIVSLPLGALSASALAPSSALAGVQALQTQSLAYGLFSGIGIALDLFFIVGLAALYFVLRNISQDRAVIATLFGLIGFAVDLSTELPLRYLQIMTAAKYTAATDVLDKNSILEVYELAFDYANITTLIVTFLLALMFLFLSFAMLTKKELFGSAISYLALLTAVLALLAILLSLVPAVSDLHIKHMLWLA